MKLHVTIFAALITLTAAQAQSPDVVSLFGEAHERGPMLQWELSSARHSSQPRWSPNQGMPPVPIGRAVELGHIWLKKKHPEVKDFAVSSIQLAPIGYGRPPADRWYYRIEFLPIVSGQVLFGGGFVAVVLFDGTIVEPRAEPRPRGG